MNYAALSAVSFAFAAILAPLAAGQPLRQPLPSDLEEIDSHIRKADAAVSNAYLRARDTKKEIEEELGVFERAPTSQELERLSPDKAEEYRAAVRAYGAGRKYAFSQYNEAIRLTLAYYQIEPIQRSGPVPGEDSNVQVEWKTIFSEKPEPGQIPGFVYYGFMRQSDRVIIVRKNAFSHAGFLALTLQHESLHFDILLAQGDRASRDPDTELRIQKSLLPDARSIYAADDDEYRLLVANVALAQWLQIERRRGNASPDSNPGWLRDFIKGNISISDLERIDFSSPAEPLATLAHDSPQLFSKGNYNVSQMLANAITLTQAAQEFSNKQDKERLQQRKREEKAYREWLDARERARNAAWAYLKTSVGLACSSPGKFESKAGAGEIVGVGLDPLDLFFRMTSYSENSGPGSMNLCQREMMNRIYAASSPVGIADLAGWARDWREAHPSLLKRLGAALSSFAAALSSAVTNFTEALAVNGGGTGGDDGSWDRREGWPRGGNGGMGNSETLGQLRGVDAHGWGGN